MLLLLLVLVLVLVLVLHRRDGLRSLLVMPLVRRRGSSLVVRVLVLDIHGILMLGGYAA